MQTFLPFRSFKMSAQVLDKPRLQKQRVEGLQILTALSVEGTGWLNHPATVMWRDNIPALAEYILAIHNECEERGVADNIGVRKILRKFSRDPEKIEMPWWWGSSIHRSHRKSLLWKNPDLYGPVLSTEFPKMKPTSQKPRYVWPIHRDEYQFLSIRNALNSKDSRLKVVIHRYTKPRKVTGYFFKAQYGYELYGMMGKTPSIYLLQHKELNDG